MKVPRDLLLAVLDLASPALGTAKNLVPGLSHYWFDRESVTAFNDILGIRVAFISDFTGGVEGTRLLGILKNSNAKTVTLEERAKGRNPVLSVEVGSAGVILPLRPVTEALFHEEFPRNTVGAVFTASQRFIDGVKLVMLSCGNKKLASPSERGVSVLQNDEHMDLFATDEATVSWAHIDGRVMPRGRAIWPREFCDYFIRNFSAGCRVAVTDDSVWCCTDPRGTGYDVTVCSKLVEDNHPSDFRRFVEGFEEEMAVAFKVPDDLPRALQRAEAMLPEKAPIELEVVRVTMDDGEADVAVLRLYSNTALGEFDDVIELEGAAGHPDLTLKADARMLRRALTYRTSIALTRGSVILTGPPGFFHFISTRR